MTTIPVLLIDDSEPDRLFTGIVLARSGLDFEVQDFESAEDALSVLARSPQPRSLILLDINMPGMDGFEFLEAYEQQTPHPVRVVMLTSSPDPVDRLRAQRHACVGDYLTKPLDMAAARALCSPTPD